MPAPKNDAVADMIRRVAIHEAGHAITAWYSRSGLTVRLVTVTAAIVNGRIGIGGRTLVPWRGRRSYGDSAVARDYLVILMGGMAAELLCLKNADPSDEPRSDMAQACKLAMLMARSAARRRSRRNKRDPDEIEARLDQDALEEETNRLVTDALNDAVGLLRRRRREFRLVRSALVRQGLLDNDDLAELIGRQRIKKRQAGSRL